MNWLNVALLVAVLIGVGGAAFIVARSPSFWLGLMTTVFNAVLPAILKGVQPKDWTPEQRRQMDAGTSPQQAGSGLKKNREWDK